MRQVKSNVTIQCELSRTLSSLLIVACVAIVVAQARGDDALVSFGDAGRLEYQQDKRGNRLPDFSHCGYAGANRGVPKVRSTVVVGPSKQDDTKRIQVAIDYVSQLPTDEEGWRGAVLLSQGEFNISGQFLCETFGLLAPYPQALALSQRQSAAVMAAPAPEQLADRRRYDRNRDATSRSEE